MNPMRPSRSQGFTLTEMMVAVGILAFVVTAVMQTFVVQNRAYTVVGQTVEAQQNLRAIGFLMERDARMSGFMVPEGAAACGIDLPNAPDSLWLTDSDAIDPTNQVRAQLGATVASGYSPGTGSSRSLVVDSSVIDGVPFYDTDGDNLPDADFQIGGGAIFLDADAPGAGLACGTVMQVFPNRVVVIFETSIPTPPTSHRRLLVPAHLYTVNDPGFGGAPTLTRDGQLLATDVEDLQVSFFFDRDRDGLVDNADQPGGENPGAAGSDLYAAAGENHSTLRELRINLVVRTRDDDQESDSGLPQATENRAAVAVTDGFRRRVHTTTVRLRNVGFRGVAL